MAERKNAPLLMSTLLVGLAAFILGALVLYGTSLYFLGNNSEEMIVEDKVESSSFFDTEASHVFATITDVQGSTITLKNKTNKSESFPVSPQVYVSKPTDKKTVATSSGDLQSLEKNKQATINFIKKDGKYEVVSILYTPGMIPFAQ